MIHRAYKVQLKPNNQQKTLFKMNCGAARWAFNWALTKKKESLDKRERVPNYIELSRELTTIKGTNELPWAYEVSKCSFQSALRDCDNAFKNFFTRCKKKIKGKKGFPKFKSKKNEKNSFRLYDCISIKSRYIKLPRIGKVRLTEKNYIPLNCKIISATVLERAGKWFVSVQVESQDKIISQANNEVVGVDLGIKVLATCSDGTVYQNPKALKKNLRKLKRKQRQLSKKKIGSKNREKTRRKLAKLHYRISNLRKDALHKTTTKIVNENQVIVLEDLSISKMMKNHIFAQSISDASFYEFRRQIEYKAKWNGRTVIITNRFYPSSKIDHKSGIANKDLALKDRTIYHDDDTKTDRDMNAAINLRNYYLNGLHTASSAGIDACEDGGSSLSEMIAVSPSLKQEFNKKSIDRFL